MLKPITYRRALANNRRMLQRLGADAGAEAEKGTCGWHWCVTGGPR